MPYVSTTGSFQALNIDTLYVMLCHVMEIVISQSGCLIVFDRKQPENECTHCFFEHTLRLMKVSAFSTTTIETHLSL